MKSYLTTNAKTYVKAGVINSKSGLIPTDSVCYDSLPEDQKSKYLARLKRTLLRLIEDRTETTILPMEEVYKNWELVEHNYSSKYTLVLWVAFDGGTNFRLILSPQD